MQQNRANRSAQVLAVSPKSNISSVAMLTAMVALAHHVGAKSVREAVFLSTFPSTELPKAMFASAIVSVPLALLVTRAMMRWGPRIIAPALFVVSAGLWGLEWLLLPDARAVVAILVYLHVSVGGAILLSNFWSVVSERFDPHTLKRLVPRIGAAGTFGGILGGGLIERTSKLLDARSTMLLLATLSVVAAMLVGQLARGYEGSRELERASGHGGSRSYLRNIALLVLCSTLVTTFVDFALKRAAAVRFTDAENLVQFFALFYTIAAVVGFLVQILASRRLLELAGVGIVLAATPGVVLVFGAAAVMSPSLLMIAALRGAETSLASSLFRSAYEPLFGPVPAAQKRSTKAFIDVAFDKGGEALGAILVMLIVLAGANYAARVPLLLAMCAAALALYFSLRAQRGYVTELERSLRSGTISVESDEFLDPMAKLTLSGTAIGLDRVKLLERISQLRSDGAAAPAASEGAVVTRGAAANASYAESLLDDVKALLDVEPATTRTVLRRNDLDPRLAAFVIPLLAVNGLARDAAQALRTMKGPAVALMGEVMQSADALLVVRRRIPHVLRSMRGPQVVEVLSQALEAEPFVVRSRAALALREVLGGDLGGHPDPARILRLVLRELAHEPLDEASVEHVLLLLILGTGRAGIELVRQGIRSQDEKLRGTALEYLESQLPDSVRNHVIAALSAAAPPRRLQPRTVSELSDELKRSLDMRIPGLRLSDEME